MRWTYEKLDENYNFQHCPGNDPTGEITGHIVMNVKAWFDENPEERKRLGWIKHISYSPEEIREKYPHNPQSQYLTEELHQIDEWTVEDVYHVMDKSEAMMRMEELLGGMGLSVSMGYTILDANGGLIV